MRALPTPQMTVAPDNVDYAPTQVISDDVIPKPVAQQGAPYGLEPWVNHQASTYCRSDALETVVQGANQPMAVDDALKQRYSFFYWHCMMASGQQKIDPPVRGPAYLPVGAASPEHAANVSGTWNISTPPWQPATSCTFTQSGNSFSGTCKGSEGSGAAFGVIDGRQVRWAWKFSSEGSDRGGELDFIGAMDSNANITGKSVLAKDSPFNQIKPFTAMLGGSATQIASQK